MINEGYSLHAYCNMCSSLYTKAAGGFDINALTSGSMQLHGTSKEHCNRKAKALGWSLQRENKRYREWVLCPTCNTRENRRKGLIGHDHAEEEKRETTDPTQSDKD